jgi:hypothetical protein
MKKKAQRTKLPLLVFEAESWSVEINYRKPAAQSRRVGSRAVAQKPLRIAKSAVWAGPIQAVGRAVERC